MDPVERSGPHAVSDRGARHAELLSGYDSVLSRGDLGQLRIEGRVPMAGCPTFG
jgi:hypothetical protein